MYRGWRGRASRQLFFTALIVPISTFIASVVGIWVSIREDAGGNLGPFLYALGRGVSIEKSIKSTFYPHLERVLVN